MMITNGVSPRWMSFSPRLRRCGPALPVIPVWLAVPVRAHLCAALSPLPEQVMGCLPHLTLVTPPSFSPVHAVVVGKDATTVVAERVVGRGVDPLECLPTLSCLVHTYLSLPKYSLLLLRTSFVNEHPHRCRSAGGRSGACRHDDPLRCQRSRARGRSDPSSHGWAPRLQPFLSMLSA